MTLAASNTTKTLQPADSRFDDPLPQERARYEFPVEDLPEKPDGFLLERVTPVYEPKPPKEPVLEDGAKEGAIWILSEILRRLENVEDGLEGLRARIESYNVRAQHRI